MKKELIDQLRILVDMIKDGEKLQLQSKGERLFIVEHNKNILEAIQIMKETVEYMEEDDVGDCGHVSNN